MAFAAVPILIASLASAAVAAYGAYQQGQTQKKMADFNAQVADQDAKVAEQQAEAQAVQDRRQMELRVGAAKAAYGMSGVSVGSGSPVDVLGDTVSQSMLQIQNDIYQGKLKARASYNTASAERFSGKAAAQQGLYNAGSSLLSGAASAASNYKILSR